MTTLIARIVSVLFPFTVGVLVGVIGALLVGIMLTIHRPAPLEISAPEPVVQQIVQPVARQIIQQDADEDTASDDAMLVTITGTYGALDTTLAELQDFADNTPGLVIRKITRSPAGGGSRPTARVALVGPWDPIVDGMGALWRGHEIFDVHVARPRNKHVTN